MEDGFIRSVSLGAYHTQPLSICLDKSGIMYFDSEQPSHLENILNTYDFSGDIDLMRKAQISLNTLKENKLSKYNDAQHIDMRSIYGPKKKKRVLVLGQVEDDQSVLRGCNIKNVTNNDIVRLAKQENPDAQIIYKPHPDVFARKRKKISNPRDVEDMAFILKQKVSLADSLFEVDHVYTITSLSGFEALIHDIPTVTTVGCPFYSNWGLTDDRQPNPRRQRTLSVLEVFAGAYVLYPIYFSQVDCREIDILGALDELIHSFSIANNG